MGYSGRYHAASLVAVFIALAIGILIGVGLADEVVSTASQEVEDSLRSDLSEAEERADQRAAELDREREFAEGAYPALVGERLLGSRVALLGIGGLPAETASAVEEALEPTGAELAAIASIGLPPDREGLAGEAGPRHRGARRNDEALAELGRALGSRIPGGGGLVERLRRPLFERFSGTLEGVDRVVLAGVPRDGDEEETGEGGEQGPEGEGAAQDEDREAAADALLDGLIEGLRETVIGLAAVEMTSTSPTTLEPFQEAELPTVDHVDLIAGRLAMVLALAGEAEGNFGVKDGADRFLPEPLEPTPQG